MPCPKCGSQDFDEATGYGFRERIDGVPRRVCDNCGLPKAEREIEARVVDVARYKIEHRGVNHEEAEGLVDRATKVLALWKRPGLRGRTAGFVRRAYEYARRAYWVLREQTATQRIVQTKQTLDKVGRIEVRDPKFQQDLDLTRGKIEEGMALARRDLERAQTPGIRRDERKNLLKDAVENAELAFRQAVGYQRRQIKTDDEAERRRIAAAFEASAPTDVEEEEPEGSVVGPSTATSGPFEGTTEGGSGSGVAEVGEPAAVELGELEVPGVPAVEPPPADKPRSRKKANGKRARKPARSERKPTTIKLNGPNAVDDVTARRVLNNLRRRAGRRAACQKQQDATDEAAEEAREAAV